MLAKATSGFLRRDIRIHDIVRFIYLMNLLDTNETLFYHTLMEQAN
jgi:hypothetical protein